MHMQPILRLSRFVWLLAAMAMAGQLVGAVAAPEMALASSLGPVCGDEHTTPGQPARHHHHDCAVCPLCAAAAVHVALISPGPPIGARREITQASPALPPPARAPPQWHVTTRFARGPPAFA